MWKNISIRWFVINYKERFDIIFLYFGNFYLFGQSSIFRKKILTTPKPCSLYFSVSKTHLFWWHPLPHWDAQMVLTLCKDVQVQSLEDLADATAMQNQGCNERNSCGISAPNPWRLCRWNPRTEGPLHTVLVPIIQ